MRCRVAAREWILCVEMEALICCKPPDPPAGGDDADTTCLVKRRGGFSKQRRLNVTLSTEKQPDSS